MAAEPGWRERIWSSQRRLGKREWPEMLDLLNAAATRGTGRAGAISTETFGKTGTTQDHRDAVFIGFAGDLVVGIWVGNDDNSPMDKVTGGGLPAQMWHDFMTRIRVSEGAPPRAEPVAEPVDRTEIEDLLPADIGDAVAGTRQAIDEARNVQAALEGLDEGPPPGPGPEEAPPEPEEPPTDQ